MLKYTLIPLLPFLSFVINILFGRNYIKDKAHWVAIPAILGSFALATSAFIEVLNGKIMKPTPGMKKTILFGQCMYKLHKDNPDINQMIAIKGCPPKL